jgi:hypothetical protein
MGVRVTLGNQDITAWVDEPTIDIESNLGQGPGVPQGASGRATTCKFDCYMGPQGSALGSGQPLPQRNYLSKNQSDVEGDLTGLATVSTATLSRDTSTAQQGSASLKVATSGSHTNEGASASIPAGNFFANQSYTFSCYMKASSGTPTVRLLAVASDGSTVGTAQSCVLSTTWTRYTVTITAPNPVPTLWTTIGLRVDTGSTAQAITFWMDGLQIEAGHTASTWMDGGTAPFLIRQGELIVYDANGKRIFGGYATDFQDKTEYTRVKTQVTCSDYWQDLARVIINQIYTSAYDDSIITSLFKTYKPDIDLSQWSPVHTYLFTKIYLRAKTLQESLQMIADTVGFDVWINPYKQFQYRSPSNSGTAPFSVSDSPDFITKFPLAVTAYEKDDTAIINRVFFYGGKTPSTDFTQDLSPQANGTNNTFVLAYYPREASDGKIHFYLNGVEKVMGQAFSTGAANTLKNAGGTADAILNASAQAITVDSSEIPAAGSNVVSCKYRYEIPLTVMVTNQQSYSYFGRWFDGTISDTTVQDKTTAIQRARVLLLEQAYGFEHITLHCWRPGLQAGMLLRIDHNIRAIHNAYIVQSVKVQPLGDGNFQYEVDLGAWNWNLVDVMMQAGRQGNLIDQLDDESQDVVTAQENIQNLGAHIVWMTPLTRTSGAYYARATALGDGHDAYPGLFTITS